MKKLIIIWEKARFFLLAFLVAATIVGLGYPIADSLKDSVKFQRGNYKFHWFSNADSSIPFSSRLKQKILFLPYILDDWQSRIEAIYLKEAFQGPTTTPKVATYLGHFPYSEPNSDDLVKVADFYGREEFLLRTTADAFSLMKSDAKVNGVDLTLISGFRSIAQQEKLFLNQVNRKGSKEAAARSSAPPGYSEHHTGYAFDIGQGDDTDTFASYKFESTRAFSWLTNNAHKYGFEMSFPKDNVQGIIYEPWHWRYVSSQDAATIFYNARNLISN